MDNPETRSHGMRKLIRDILVGGAAPLAVFGSLGLIWLLWPVESVQTQTGFRGTGMVQFKPAEEQVRLAALNAMPESEAPYVPAGGETLARDAYENVQVLGDLTEDNFNRLMLAITEWVSPEQGCAYCHGDDGNFAADDLYTKIVSRRMLQMTQHINESWETHVAPAGVTCYTCHRGQPVPQYVWFEEPRPRGASQMGDNTMRQNRADATVGFTSLPGDPLTRFLLNDTPIRVVGKAVHETPFNASIQETEWTYGLMFHLSESLGVNCTFCHNSRAFIGWDQSPPPRYKAYYGIRMVRDLNVNFLHALDVYPPNRLGPLGDAPKANCTTCHQGVSKPLLGASMIDSWPELRRSGAPDYGGGSAAAPAPETRADAGTAAAN